ncbi:MAG: alkaline phosphatase [Gammaproteobacteria bacterium]|nr:MAG: alkaline phosphatase [Gammaproteobacteria bacterium]
MTNSYTNSVKFLLLIIALLVGFTSCKTNPVKLITESEDSKPVKNIILMIGDGMGPAYLKAYRQFMDNPETPQIEQTEFDKILTGTVATDPLNNDDEYGRITDSAASATAYATGHKVLSRSLSITAEGKKLKTVLEQAKSNGLSTGLIVTSLLTDATPAAFIAHHPSRYEYSKIADYYLDNYDEQAQLMFDVVLGGGREYFVREDRDLMAELTKKGFKTIKNKTDLLTNQDSKIVGLFAQRQLNKFWDRDEKTPSLAEMTAAAIKVLSQNKKGFFLMVEASQIDWAGHRNNIVGVMSEMQDFELALKVALKFANEDGQTQIILTADHETGGLSLGTRYDNKNKYYWKGRVIKQFTKTPEEIVKRALYSNDLLAEFKRASSLVLNKEEEESLKSFKFVKEVENKTSSKISAREKRKNSNKQKNKAVDLITDIVNRHTNTGWTTRSHTGVDVNLYAFGPKSNELRGHFDNTKIGQFIFELLDENNH